jgi:heterodisulfide reductase subunit B
VSKFALFPGCSLEKIGQSYYQSTLETAERLGVELRELEDWNCCGATAYFHVDELLAYTLSARNLALAEKQGLDVVAPCAACYKNMYFTRAYLLEDPDLADHINTALQEDDLTFRGGSAVRHLLEVYCQDVPRAEIEKAVQRPLEGLRVVPYYGCQIVRPRKDGEEVELPRFFEDLLSAIGATPVDFPYKTRCCGGSLMITSRPAALSLARDLLQLAQARQASVIATACPLCQVNLECYQTQVNQEFGTNFAIPVMYFTQIMGLAFGVPARKLGVGSELVSTGPVASFAEAAS